MPEEIEIDPRLALSPASRHPSDFAVEVPGRSEILHEERVVKRVGHALPLESPNLEHERHVERDLP